MESFIVALFFAVCVMTSSNAYHVRIPAPKPAPAPAPVPAPAPLLAPAPAPGEHSIFLLYFQHFQMITNY